MKPIRSIFISLLLLGGVVYSASFPLTLTDELGRELTLEAAPERVVSMLPSHTETVCAIGVCDKLVGVDDFSDYPAQVADLPKLGSGLSGANVEAIIALEPDLVLVSEYGELAQTLSNAGLNVYAGSPQTFEETFAFFQTLGRLVDRELESILLSRKVRDTIEGIATVVAQAPAPTVYYELDATPYSVGPNSFIGSLIAKAGGRNIVLETMGDFPQLDPEFIVASDPEVIILADADYGESLETLRARPGWAGMQALRAGGVYPLRAAQTQVINRAGPRMAEAVRYLAALLHPDLID